VTLPSNVRCTNCTLQVFQFMSQHALNVPGGCFYHHCATINVVAPDAGVMPVDAGTTGGGSAGGGMASTGGGMASTGGGTSAFGGGSSGLTTDAGVDPGPVGGCGCTGGAGSILLAGFALLGGVLRRRQYR